MAAKKFVHRVKAAQVVAKVPGAQGGEVYLRRGRTLPDTVESSEIKRLSGLGLIERVEIVDAAAEAEAKAAADAKAKAAADAKAKADAAAAAAAQQ